MSPTGFRLGRAFAGILLCVASLAPVARGQRGAVAAGFPSAMFTPPAGPTHAGATRRHGTFALAGANPRILLTGYWPPSNEAVRRFSPDPTQNPQGWVGQDWENKGYDVYAYFPEFNPPTCGYCGKGTGDLEVDYQDTSQDFWPIAEALKPIAVITFSRGFPGKDWEVEMNQYNKTAWYDDFLAPTVPTPNPPDASVPAGTLRLSTLPVTDIVNAVNAAALGVNAYVCFTGDGGGFLSEFIAYHGVWYQSMHASPADPDWCIAAGHVHVGDEIGWHAAAAAAEVTLRTVIQHVDAVLSATTCQADLGSGGPGTSALALCGDPLQTGGKADLLLYGAKPSSPAFLFAGGTQNPLPLGLGTFLPGPPLLLIPVWTTTEGEVFVDDLPGGGGPITAFLQAVHADPALQGGIGLSNALKIDLLP